ncbi:hypothetical protein [Streptomyces sp. NPDC047315]|uniref:hypothetical protein n=1 Tax=Streptomyces sp. NPDC047315 TaxID=3155142 RepID=UPI0033FC8BB2
MIWIITAAALIWGAGCIAIRYAVEPHTTTAPKRLARCSCGRPIPAAYAHCPRCAGGPGA